MRQPRPKGKLSLPIVISIFKFHVLAPTYQGQEYHLNFV